MMSWNLTTYLLDAHRFPFIATMAKPFTKFCINNFVVPFSFFVFYFCHIVYFQGYYELRSFDNIMWNCVGFLLGCILLISLLALYFHFTNKDILNFEKTRTVPPNLTGRLAPGRPYINIDSIRENRTKWKEETYLSTSLQPMLVRSVTHYDKETLFKVFKQNHLNILVVQLFGFFLLNLTWFS